MGGMDFGGTVLLAALGAFSLLFFVVGIVFYVLKSIGLSTLAANRGLDNPWLAWIPVADLYIMGMLVEEIDGIMGPGHFCWRRDILRYSCAWLAGQHSLDYICDTLHI